jgi:biopolymer transport protein ExbB
MLEKILRPANLIAILLFGFVLVSAVFIATDAFAQDAAAPAANAPAADAAAGAGGETTTAQKRNLLAEVYYGLTPLYFFAFLIMSILFITFLVMGIMATGKSSFTPPDLIQGVDESLQSGNPQAAVDLVRADESFLGQIVGAGLEKISGGRDTAMENMAITGEDETMKLEHKLSYLALLGNIAPMVGLLGTVHGMILSFAVIANSDQTPKPAKLAGGIQTALYTTMAGLILAIPAIIAFNLLKSKMQRQVAEAGHEAEAMLDRFTQVVR